MSNSLDQANADIAGREASPAATVTQLSHTTYVSREGLSALVDQVEATIPDGEYFGKAVVSAASLPDDSPSVLWAYRRRRTGKRGRAGYKPAITVTAYASGAVVFQGFDPASLAA